MQYIGLDLSLTGTGFYWLDDSGAAVRGEKLHVVQTGVERLFFLREKLRSLLDDLPDDTIFACMESAAYHEVGRLYDLGQWAGIVMIELFERGIPFISAAPLQLKKFISGAGKNAGKQTVILDVYKNYGIEVRDDNIADAFVLSQIAFNYYQMYVLKDKLDIAAHQIDVLKKINKSESVARNLIL